MVFGEIVEPSTRALIDDEFEEYPDYVKPELNWEGNLSVPANLDTLIFVEGQKITKLFTALVLQGQSLYSQLKEGELQIFEIPNNKFIVCYSKKNISTGEIVEELSQWLKKAKHIFSIISQPISAYQNLSFSEKPETLIRQLSTEKNIKFGIPKLEPPNLISGFGAEVLTYCINSGLNSTLFVVFMNNSPLDSVNVSPVMQLMQSLNLPVSKSTANLNPVQSNLYL